MKQNYSAPTVPSAYIAVNKSRIKKYETSDSMPTYYLQKGAEFQIELFNPTSDVLLAKIILNGKPISQGGLVLNPGQRVFLDRYLDVAQKFLFDTYEVSNTSEVKKAIEDNGDIKVEFYRETRYVPQPYILPNWTYNQNIFRSNLGNYNAGTDVKNLIGGTSANNNFFNSTSSTALYSSSVKCGEVNLFGADYLSDTGPIPDNKLNLKRGLPKKRFKKSIETGRVEKGSHSDQEFKYVDKIFDFIPFHTVEYKLLPISQKINTADDLNVKRYCVACGSKVGKTDKFCAKCGKKI